MPLVILAKLQQRCNNWVVLLPQSFLLCLREEVEEVMNQSPGVHQVTTVLLIRTYQILKTCLRILTANVMSLHALKIPSITKYTMLVNLSIKYLVNPTVKFLMNPSIKIFGIISIGIEGIILSTTLMGLLTLMVLSFLTLVNALIERCMILICLVVILMTCPIQ